MLTAVRCVEDVQIKTIGKRQAQESQWGGTFSSLFSVFVSIGVPFTIKVCMLVPRPSPKASTKRVSHKGIIIKPFFYKTVDDEAHFKKTLLRKTPPSKKKLQRLIVHGVNKEINQKKKTLEKWNYGKIITRVYFIFFVFSHKMGRATKPKTQRKKNKRPEPKTSDLKGRPFQKFITQRNTPFLEDKKGGSQ